MTDLNAPSTGDLEEALTYSRLAHQHAPDHAMATKMWGEHPIIVAWDSVQHLWWLRYPAQPQQRVSRYGSEYFAQLHELKAFLLAILHVATRTGWMNA